MIICHRHKFIFLKTEKTAGTAIEAALSELCGPEDVITPFREESEGGPQGARSAKLSHRPSTQAGGPLWRKLLMRPERYYHPSVGFYEHMPAWRVRAYVGEEMWRDISSSPSCAIRGTGRSPNTFLQDEVTNLRPNLDRFMARKKRAYVTSHEIYAIDGVVAVDFVGRYADFSSMRT